MNTSTMSLIMVLLSICIFGCTDVPRHQVQPSTATSARVPPPAPKPQPRQWSEKQLNLLRSFALQESPKLWQTVQALRAEQATRAAALTKLRAELVDFGRDPSADLDYISLKSSNNELVDSLNVIYAKIEDAYIAYKKFQATPGNKEYGDIMRRVLEDGIQEAGNAERRYLQMSKQK